MLPCDHIIWKQFNLKCFLVHLREIDCNTMSLETIYGWCLLSTYMTASICQIVNITLYTNL